MGEVKNSLLMLIATLGVLILLGFLMFVNVPKDNAQILLAIVGPLLGFYFGSSVNKQPVPDTISQATGLSLPPEAAAFTDALGTAVNSLKEK